MSWFNEHQEAELQMLNSMKPEEKCFCGWYRLADCHCEKGKGKTFADSEEYKERCLPKENTHD